MPATITAEDVRSGFQSAASDAEIELLISVVDGADACLASYSDDKAKVLKLYAVRHMLTLTANNGSGLVTSRRSPNGGGLTYSFQTKAGLGATSFGQALLQLDGKGCLAALIANDSGINVWSVGRKTEDD